MNNIDNLVKYSYYNGEFIFKQDFRGSLEDYALYLQKMLEYYDIPDYIYEFIAIAIDDHNLQSDIGDKIDERYVLEAIKHTEGDIKKIYLGLLKSVARYSYQNNKFISEDNFSTNKSYVAYLNGLLQYNIPNNMYTDIADAIVGRDLQSQIKITNYFLMQAIKNTDGEAREVYLKLLPNVNYFTIDDIKYLYSIGYGDINYLKKATQISLNSLASLVREYNLDVMEVYDLVKNTSVGEDFALWILINVPASKGKFGHLLQIIDLDRMSVLRTKALLKHGLYTVESLLLQYFTRDDIKWDIYTIQYLVIEMLTSGRVKSIYELLTKYTRNDQRLKGIVKSFVDNAILNQV